MITKQKPRLLFVDDDVHLVQGLKRALRIQASSWDMEFYSSPQEALMRAEQVEFDIIVSDLRMPELDGATFLRAATFRSPTSTRAILSGQGDEASILRCLQVAHQHFAKPCDIATLIDRLNRVLFYRKVIPHPMLRAQLCSIQRLPVEEPILARLREELKSSSPSQLIISELVAQDVGLSVRILQLTNSSFFGIAEETLAVGRAVGRLGVETIRKVVFDAEVFEELRLPSGLEKLPRLLRSQNEDPLLQLAMEEAMSPSDLAETLAIRCRFLGIIVLFQYWPSLATYIGEWLDAKSAESLSSQLDILGFPFVNIGLFMMGNFGMPLKLLERTHKLCREMEMRFPELV